ncbi:MAG: hypothetical protein QM683_02750 [Lacrimispora sp.]
MVVFEGAIDKGVIYDEDREVVKGKFMNGLLAAAGTIFRSVHVFRIVPATNRGRG